MLRVAAGAVEVGVRIPNTLDGGYHPQVVDLYIPNGTINRALVSLHGGGGNERQMALYMGVLTRYTTPTADLTNWRWLEYFHAVGVFPRGQACVGPGTAYSVDENGTPLASWPAGGNPYNPGDVNSISSGFPAGITCWQSGFMRSGANDEQFLTDLRTYLANRFGILGVSLCGHSAGGFMVKRMWLLGSAYTRYVSFAGPLAEAWKGTAMPGTLRPLLSVQGELDDTIGVLDFDDKTTKHTYDDSWQQDPTHVTRVDVTFPMPGQHVGDWKLLGERVGAATAETPAIADAVVEAVAIGNKRTWSYDDGRQQLVILEQAGHEMVSLTRTIGAPLLLVALGWIAVT